METPETLDQKQERLKRERRIVDYNNKGDELNTNYNLDRYPYGEVRPTPSLEVCRATVAMLKVRLAKRPTEELEVTR